MITSSSNEINILYSSDNNYAQHLGVSIYTLLDKNRQFDSISIYVVNNGIDDNNISRLHQLIGQFSNAHLILVPFDSWKEQLHLNMQWEISISSYARLFVASILPMHVQRVLYLDCDMLIYESLDLLWKTELCGHILGAVQDSIGNKTKSAIDLIPTTKYFNAGMLLIDLSAWRNANIERKALSYIESKQGNVTHHDQGVLNNLLYNDVLILPLQYNVMTIHFFFNRAKLLKFSGENADFYSEEEIENAKLNPVILHFTPSLTPRPWIKGCHHPRCADYWAALNKTPWKMSTPRKCTNKWYVRVIEWLYRKII